VNWHITCLSCGSARHRATFPTSCEACDSQVVIITDERPIAMSNKALEEWLAAGNTPEQIPADANIDTKICINCGIKRPSDSFVKVNNYSRCSVCLERRNEAITERRKNSV